MKIKLIGFEMKMGMGVTLAEVFKIIGGTGGDPVRIGDHNRFTYIDKIDDFHVGLLITTKDHNKFLEFKHDKANAKLEARDVSAGAKFADFNFFAVNEATGKGIYQYYHQSCSVNSFGVLCRTFYENIKQKRIDAAKAKIKTLKPSDEKAINKAYAGTLKLEILVRQETFDKMVTDMKSISAVTLSVSTIAYQETAFSQLALVAKNMSQRYSFSKDSLVTNIASSILSVARKANIQSAKVEGLGEDGLEQIVKMFNTPDIFGEHEFDDIAQTMTISPIDFAKSEFLKTMIKVAKEELVLREVAKK